MRKNILILLTLCVLINIGFIFTGCVNARDIEVSDNYADLIYDDKLICTSSAQQYIEPETDYMALMISAAMNNDYCLGEWAAFGRDSKIDNQSLDIIKIEFDELSLLSRIIYAEAGSNWLSDEWKMCVGEVVLNRVASPEFPDSIRAVLEQPGQYYGANSSYFNKILPTERCIRIALRLLEGDRILNNPAVVFQANFAQGGGVHTAFYDKSYGWTYFCISNRLYLYYTES